MAHNVVILGTGPAGLTAAIYAARANLEPVVIEGMQAGGQLMITSEVENFPGFSEGILGPELMANFRKQAERFGTKFITGEVTKVDFRSQSFKLSTDKETIEAKTVIIATGASANLLGLPNESRLMGRGVSACATCDGFFFKNLEIAVAGGGDSACEEANFLTKFASKVTLIHRRDSLRASKIMAERTLQNPKIRMIWDTVIDDVLGKDEVTGLKLRNVKTGATSEFKTSGLFVAIGHSPNTKIFDGQLELDAKKYILTHGGSKTSVPGVFACGDVQDKIYRQAITAAGSGCMAAIDAERHLESLHA